MTTSGLAERLGHGPDAHLVIVTSAGLGGCHAMNDGVYRSLREGVATTASIMMPCPWARESAARYRGEDVGVLLTLNAEFEHYRWGPITQAPSLLDGDGGFPRTVTDVWDHADPDELRRECRAQLERAVLWGFDITHLASHLDVHTMRPEFFDVFLDLACEFELPVRLLPDAQAAQVGFPIRELAAEEGILTPDRVIRVIGGAHRADIVETALADCGPGVTEIEFRPGSDLPELRSVATDWPERVDDLDQLTSPSALRSVLDRLGVQRIGYRELRDLQRS